jgi:hypothetical protein
MLQCLYCGGVEMVYSSLRSQHWRQHYQQQTHRWWAGASAECDDGVWHSVICFEAVAAWIRDQDTSLWMETTCPSSIGNTFDIANSLMVLLALRWSDGRA